MACGRVDYSGGVGSCGDRIGSDGIWERLVYNKYRGGIYGEIRTGGGAWWGLLVMVYAGGRGCGHGRGLRRGVVDA